MRKVIVGILLAVIVLSAAAPALTMAQSQKNLYQATQDTGLYKTFLTSADSAGFKSTLIDRRAIYDISAYGRRI